MGIPGDGTDWSINSTQFIREKLLGSDAFYSFNVGFDDNAQIFTLEVSWTLQFYTINDLFHHFAHKLFFESIMIMRVFT